MVGAIEAGDEGTTGLRVTVLGQVGASRHGHPIALQPGQRQLLSLLVAVGPDGATIEWLANEIWGEQQPNRWSESIRMAFTRLRRRLDLEIKPRNGRYHLDLDRRCVDAWHLLDLTRAGTGWDPALEPYLLPGAVFPGVEVSPGLQLAAAELMGAQRSAIERLSHEPDRAHPALLPVLARHLDDDPYDENLCFAVALIHARNARAEAAVAMIDRCATLRREALGRAQSPQLETLRDDIIGHRLAGPPTAPTPLPGREIRPPAPIAIARYRAPWFVGRRSELDQLTAALDPEQPAVIVLRGRPACGKTALLAELMQTAVDQGCYVIRVAGGSGERVGLGPFASALPEFRAAVATGEHLTADPLARRSLLTARLVEAMERAALGRRIVLVVDDAHWLDSMSCDLIDHLAHAATTAGTTSVILAARRAERRGPWTDLQTRLDRLPHLVSFELGPLTEDELTELVGRRRPNTPLARRAQYCRWLHRVSGGLPGVATALLGGDDDGNDTTDVAQIYDRLLEPVSPATRAVGTAAAVLGSRFRIADLAALLDRDEATLDDPLEELVGRDLMVETGTLGDFEFTHQLVTDAFLRSGLSTRRARLHLAAASLTTDEHELARHQLAAGPLVEAKDRREAALASARRHLADGAFFEAVTAFRAAVAVDCAREPDARSDARDHGDGGEGDGENEGDGSDDAEPDPTGVLDAADLVRYATALSLGGLRAAATTIRARAYDRALIEDRWDLALDAAVAGLPLAELQDGEPDRLAHLEGIDPHRLDNARRLTQALIASRQATMQGDLSRGRHWADQAEALAREDEDRALAAIARRFVDSTVIAAPDRLARTTASVAGLTVSARSRCRLAQFAAIDLVEQGRGPEAVAALDQFQSLAVATGDSLRHWHALLFRSMVHDTAGDWAAADTAADQALALGRRHGIAEAGIVRLSQVFFRLRITGGLALLVDGVEAVPEPDGSSLLFTAARATILDAAGRDREAAAAAVELAQRALAHPSAASISCLAMVAPLLGRHGSPTLRDQARRALAPFAGCALVVGTGLGHLGPVDALIANLDRPTGRTLEQALRRAVAQSDRFGLVSWGVRYRLDLAAVTGSQDPRDEARALAHGTDLAAVVDPTVPA